mgnify:CR=1 FL=1
MKKVGRLIYVEINDENISTNHRLPAPRNLDTTGRREKQEPAIIVKFVRRDMRDKFYSSRNNYDRDQRGILEWDVLKSEESSF